MRSFVQEPTASRPTVSRAPGMPERARREPGGDAGSITGRLAPAGHDFSRIPIYPRTETKSVDKAGPVAPEPGKTAQGKTGAGGAIIIETDSPDAGVRGGGDGGAAPVQGQQPAQPPTAPKKTVGIDSFSVGWKKNANAGPTIAKLRLDTTAKFKKDATHDPALAEYRQNAAYNFEVTDGPNKGFKSSQPLQDDHYSRADDTAGHAIGDADFETNDNPGTSAQTPIDKDDVIDYSFTAEQMIVDTSDGNKVLQKRGPHTGTIKGKDPRAFDGVPATLS